MWSSQYIQKKHLTNLQSTLNFIKHFISVVSAFLKLPLFSMLIWAISVVRLWYSPQIASLWLRFGLVLCFAYDLTNMSRGILILYKKLIVWSDGGESASQCRGHGFNHWSRKIPPATDQLSLHHNFWACTLEPQ